MWQWLPIVLIITCAAPDNILGQGVPEAIGGWIIDVNRKCGPLSGKTPEQLDPEVRKECEQYAVKANEILGLPAGGGFAVLPAVIRQQLGLPLHALGDIKPCDRSDHRSEYLKYTGLL